MVEKECFEQKNLPSFGNLEGFCFTTLLQPAALLVHLFPRRVNVVPTKMSVRRRRLIDQLPQIQIANDRRRAQVKVLIDHFDEVFISQSPVISSQ
jgi:hypothetical protein